MAKVWIWLEILIKRLEAFNYLQLLIKRVTPNQKPMVHKENDLNLRVKGTDKKQKNKKNIMNKIQIENDNLYTDSRVLINEFVKQGRTILFDDEVEAEKFSKKKSSYYYDVYNSSGRSAGFDVPTTVNKLIKK